MNLAYLERKVTGYRKDGTSFSVRCDHRDIAMYRIKQMQGDPTVLKIEVKVLETGVKVVWAPDPQTRRMEWTGPFVPSRRAA